MIPRILQRLETARQEFTWRELCYRLSPCSTVLRWRARCEAGQKPVKTPGPQKRGAEVEGPLREAIGQLEHGPRRTLGTGALYEQWSELISRRDFQELVAQERQMRNEDMKRITWLKPGTVWSMDTTEYGLEKLKITPVRDLASRYQIPTPLVQPTEDGTRIADYLDLILRQEGAPMFLKRDLGSPLNCGAVDEVLEKHGVLPLNSPPGYPRYNGAMERSMQDLKAMLDEQRLEEMVGRMPMAVELERATHKLNHRRLRSLGGRTPCQCYHAPEGRIRLHGAVRKQIFREIFGRYWHVAQTMPERTPHQLRATWRWVVEEWLRRHQWILVRTNQHKPVSTISTDFHSHN